MAVDGCGIACKYVIIVFNIIFAVLGLAFLGFGLWLRFSNNTRPIFQVEELNASAFVTAVTLLIVIGAVMLVLVSFGDHGACNEKRCSLVVFSVLLFLVAATELLVGILCYANKDKVGRYLSEFYGSLYTLYVGTGDPAIGVVLTFIHELVHCCGMTGITVLELVKKTCPSPESFLDHFMPSCPGVIGNVFDRKASLVMGCFVGTGTLLVVALVCSCTLSKKILQAASAPQYIILTQTTTVLPERPLVYTSGPDPGPVVFTPLTDARLPPSARLADL